MSITVVGSAGTHASADRVCSSYLLACQGTNVVLDLGAGALHNLQKVIDLADLDAVFISHMHPDHFLDLYGLNYALRFHPASPGPIPVHGPVDLLEKMAAVLPEESVEKMRDLLHFHHREAGEVLQLGPFSVELHRMNHPMHTLGARVTCPDGTVVAYTGDTAPCEAITQLGAGADLLVCDATWMERQRPLPPDVHCTGAEAGMAAAAAGAKRLLITHVSPYNDPTAVADEAAGHYDGEVIVAHDLQEILL